MLQTHTLARTRVRAHTTNVTKSAHFGHLTQGLVVVCVPDANQHMCRLRAAQTPRWRRKHVLAENNSSSVENKTRVHETHTHTCS